MEWVAGNLLENRCGRPTLQSLQDGGDDPEFDFFLLESFHFNDGYDHVNQFSNGDASDVATVALRKFLHSEAIKGEYCCWNVSSMAYVLSQAQDDDTTAKRKRDDCPYHEAIPFLRNGFFQDAALVRKDRDNARILVGAFGHFEDVLKTEAQVMPMVVQLKAAGSCGNKPTGKDGEILTRVETTVNRRNEAAMEHDQMSINSAIAGGAPYVPLKDGTTEQELRCLRNDLEVLVRQGGSIAKSTALHVASEKNITKVAKLLLQMDSSSVRTKDLLGRTPLMVAALNAAGRLSIIGIRDTEVIDALLSVSSNKGERDVVGMTAYGHFRKTSEIFMNVVSYDSRARIASLESKLYPPGGPSEADLSKGTGGISGFVDYGSEDDEADREMGRGVYSCSDNEDHIGDY